MQILCLTSLIHRKSDDIQEWEQYIDCKWKFSEIQIGKRVNDKKPAYYFLLFRDGQKIFEAEMTPGAMKVLDQKYKSVLTAKGKKIKDFELLEIETAEEGQFFLPSMVYLEKLRIRCVRVPGGILDDTAIKEKLIEYAEKINNAVDVNVLRQNLNNQFDGAKFLEAYDQIVEGIEPLILDYGKNNKAPRHLNKHSEIRLAIADLCDPINGSPDNVKPGAKHNTFIADADLKIKPRKSHTKGKNYDIRHETNDKRLYDTCVTLDFSNVHLPAVNPRWFDSISLRKLSFKHVSVFKTPNAWRIFVNNIGRLPNLYELSIVGCEITRIPLQFYKNVTKVLKNLILLGNDLVTISPQIRRLRNLKYLDLCNNPQLNDIPRDYFPATLTSVFLINTEVRGIPRDIQASTASIEDMNTAVQDYYAFKDIIVEFESESATTTDVYLFGRGIKNFDDSNLRSQIETLDLTNNFIETLTFTTEFNFLTYLCLSNNRLKSINWESLPVTLENLDLSDNILTEIGDVKHLKHLQILNMADNYIEELVENCFIHMIHLKDINLSYNYLVSLPMSFEKIKLQDEDGDDGLTLNLQYNYFTFTDDDNLNEALWNRLPVTKRLYLCGNSLKKLPCALAEKIRPSILYAADCEIRYVCPRLYSMFTYLNLVNNPMDALPFVPMTKLSLPSKEPVEVLNYNEDGKFFVMQSSIAQPLDKFPKQGNVPLYDFKRIDFNEINPCRCCAVCGKHETIMIKQMMVMDFTLLIVNKNEYREDTDRECGYSDFAYSSYPSGTWITEIRTQMCEMCILKRKEEVEQIVTEKEKPSISEQDFCYDNLPLDTCKFGSISRSLIANDNFTSKNIGRPDKIPYNPPSEDWIQQTTKRLELPFIRYVFYQVAACDDISILQLTSSARVIADGHSGYRSLSYLITGNEHFYGDFRLLLSDAIINNNDPNFENLYGFKNARENAKIRKSADPSLPCSSKIQLMQDIDIAAAAYLFQCNIIVKIGHSIWNIYNSNTFTMGLDTEQEVIQEHPTILLDNSNFDHEQFDPIIRWDDNDFKRTKHVPEDDAMELTENLNAEDTASTDLLMIHSKSDDQLMTLYPNNEDNCCLPINETSLFNEIDVVGEMFGQMKIPYQPPSETWIRETCQRLNLNFEKYVLENSNACEDLYECQPNLISAVMADGHCGYRTISYLISGSENLHKDYRIAISDTIINNDDPNFENLYGFKDAKKYAKIKRNVDSCCSDKEWMHSVDIAAAAHMLKCNIVIKSGHSIWNIYNSETFVKGLLSKQHVMLDRPTILMDHYTRPDHFDPIISVVQKSHNDKSYDIANDQSNRHILVVKTELSGIPSNMEEIETIKYHCSMDNRRDKNKMDTSNISKILDEIFDEKVLQRMRELTILHVEDPENTERLDLTGLNIKIFDDTELPAKIEDLDLTDNFIEKLVFRQNFESLDCLALTNNGLKYVEWETLPHNLGVIDFSDNLLTTVPMVKHLKNLSYLDVSRNHITQITAEFNLLTELREINLSHNELTSLPQGFEFVGAGGDKWLDINLRDNKFDHNTQNLTDVLWDRLPGVKRLLLCRNKLGHLPCQLATRIGAAEIIAVTCDIGFICPLIYSKFRLLCIYDNPALYALPFIPKNILPPPAEEPKIKVKEVHTDEKALLFRPSIAKLVKDFPKWNEKPMYDFANVEEPQGKLAHLQCQCCAVCGCSDTKIVSQMMVMDFTLLLTQKLDEDDEIIRSMGTEHSVKESGEWITKVRTRLCDGCKEILFQQTKIAYNQSQIVTTRDIDEVPSKQPRGETRFSSPQSDLPIVEPTSRGLPIDYGAVSVTDLHNTFSNEQPLLNYLQGDANMHEITQYDYEPNFSATPYVTYSEPNQQSIHYSETNTSTTPYVPLNQNSQQCDPTFSTSSYVTYYQPHQQYGCEPNVSATPHIPYDQPYQQYDYDYEQTVCTTSQTNPNYADNNSGYQQMCDLPGPNVQEIPQVTRFYDNHQIQLANNTTHQEQQSLDSNIQDLTRINYDLNDNHYFPPPILPHTYEQNLPQESGFMMTSLEPYPTESTLNMQELSGQPLGYQIVETGNNTVEQNMEQYQIHQNLPPINNLLHRDKSSQ